MTIVSWLNRRITQLAVGSHLAHRTVRVRLTLLYGALFLLSSAALLAITYALFVNATGFVLTGQNGWTAEVDNGHLVDLTRSVQAPQRKCFPHCTADPVAMPSATEQHQLAAQANDQHGHVLRYLALESGIALAGMSVLALGVGWLMAGRVLQPLQDSYQAGLARREHLDLASLTSQAMRARESQIAGLELGVRSTLAAAPTTGDPRLIERLITNLIDNAVRHNTPGGQIEVAAGTRDRRAFASIANTGPNVPPEEIQRLFQPFQRLGAARTRHNNDARV